MFEPVFQGVRYETIIIIKSESALSPRQKVCADIVEDIAYKIEHAGGKNIKIDKLGLRKLAYPIEGRGTGYYVSIEYSFDDHTKAEKFTERIMKYYKNNDYILRYIIVKKD